MSTEMTYDEYNWNASQIGTLQYLLEGLPEERAIERIGLQSRLNRIRERLDGVSVPPRPKKLAVSFHGAPVQACYGIDANFSAEASAMVSDTIRLTTAGMTGELQATGQIPRTSLSQPMITGIAYGSFGFELEIPTPPDEPNGFCYPEEAVNRLQQLLGATREGEDDDLSLAIASIHPRAVNKVAALFDFMKRNKAQFSLEYRGTLVQFETDDEIKNAIKRLAPRNNENRTYGVTGTLIGLIPETRSFQLNTDQGERIHGRVGFEIQNPDQASIRYSYQQVRAQIRTVRVGRGIPRHTLLSISELPNSS